MTNETESNKNSYECGINDTIKWIYQNLALDEPFPEKVLKSELLKGKSENVEVINNPKTLREDVPIPLTEDILKVNGFMYTGGCLLFAPRGVDDYNLYIECGVRRNGEVRRIEMFNFGRSFKIDRSECIYVHELQHAMRLCGLIELADNFKVCR